MGTFSNLKNSLLLAAGVLLLSSSGLAATADYYKCSDRVGGEYNYGRAPQACNANTFGDDKFVLSTYPTLIYNDTAASTERARYVDEMNAVIRDAAIYYIKKRKPEVTTAESQHWVLAILATASNESYWSQYRKASDARLKEMRGDVGHGHGMMQIDDRSHLDVINTGIAWNLMTNLTYAMDIFYKNWQTATTKSCVKSATDYESRTRAAWAAYNGGSAKFCRWTDPNDTWAANDKNFYAHFSKRLWEKYNANPAKKPSIDVPCLIEKKENCPAPGAGSDQAILNPGILYQTTTGLYCVLASSKASCVKDARDAICLKQVSHYATDTATAIKDTALTPYSPATLDRHTLCAQYEPTLYPVSTEIQVQKNTNLRATPGGGIVAVVPKDQVLTILDFELRNAPDNDRYYKVNYQGKEGYLYAGMKTDYQSWATQNVSSTLPSSIARVGEFIRVVNAAGINQRSTPGGTLLKLIPKNTQLQVLDVYVEDSNNKVYYRVSYQGQVGYVYTGLLLPTDTTAEWTEVLR